MHTCMINTRFDGEANGPITAVQGGVTIVGRLETPLEARTPHAARNAIAPQLDLGKLDGAGYAEI